MNVLTILAAEEHDPARSIHWLWPEAAELIYGTVASLIIFALLYKFAGPMVAKMFTDRTDRIQGELDASADALSHAETEAAEIRRAAGDIDTERQRRFAEADAEAETLLAEGREALAAELAELRARADAEIVAAGSRLNDELSSEIAQLASRSVDAAIADGVVDDGTQQELIEGFITRVGQGAQS